MPSVEVPKVDVSSTIMEILKDELEAIMVADPNLYKDFHLVLSMEQQFVKEREQTFHNYIYIVIKLSQGVKDNGQLQQGVLISAVGENNSVEVCQRLLHELSQTYSVNAAPISKGDLIIKQAYSTPIVMQNFNRVNDGYRSLFYMSGTFFIGFNINLIEEINWIKDDTHSYPISFIVANTHYSAQLDPRSQFGSNDFTKSVAMIRTLSLTMTIYNTVDDFNTAIYNVIFGKSSVDTVFKFAITYKNADIEDGSGKKHIMEVEMRLVDVADSQQLRAFPARSLTFTM